MTAIQHNCVTTFYTAECALRTPHKTLNGASSAKR
jgi:hypothetical protein